jgi:hypothetical protein
MGRIMVVQPPDEEAEAEAEGGDRHARYFARVRCSAWHRPMYLEMYRHCDRGWKGLFRRCV